MKFFALFALLLISQLAGAQTNLTGPAAELFQQAKSGKFYSTAARLKPEIVFVPLVLVLRIEKNRLRSDGFMVGARAIGTSEWYCLDGSVLAKQPGLFAQLFPGLPADLKLPASKVEVLK